MGRLLCDWRSLKEKAALGRLDLISCRDMQSPEFLEMQGKCTL